MKILLFQHHFTFTSFIILMLIAPMSYCHEEADDYEACSRIFDCGNLKNLSYPFWSENGGRPLLCGEEEFKLLNCLEGQNPSIIFEALEFVVSNINLSTNTMTISLRDICPAMEYFPMTTRLNEILSGYGDGLQNISFFYQCNSVPPTIPTQNRFQCRSFNQRREAFFTNDTETQEYREQCLSTVEFPVPRVAIENVMNGVQEVERIVTERFNVTYHSNGLCSRCNSSGGICGTKLTNRDFACYCDHHHPDPYTCFKRGGSNWRWKAIIGSISGGIGILFALITICYIGRRDNPHIFLLSFLQSGKLNNQDIEDFMKNYESLVPTRYSYADIRKITNLFKEKLGQGGFGTVYKGKLLGGRLVAVKILNKSKGNGEEFINEVASISRTSHVNVVSLLGFCLDRNKRALIYDFMPNGSLDKFIGSENHQNTKQNLEWEKSYQIALGVARGLEYLHRGCNTRIVHFDIKPHNILLDNDFLPKISDFGLAKLCTKEKSVLSMLEARGTIGYIAPEVFSRNFGGVSHKSDVYSYGMVLLEMVGEKRKVDSVTSDASEKYFPYWVYKHIELNKFGDLGVSGVEDIEIVRKMAIVGLWCIQTNPSDRPSMSKVIELFERNIEILEVPPKPFVFSPVRSASDSCTLSLL